jgi:hypothetical protein
MTMITNSSSVPPETDCAEIELSPTLGAHDQIVAGGNRMMAADDLPVTIAIGELDRAGMLSQASDPSRRIGTEGLRLDLGRGQQTGSQGEEKAG